MTPDVRNIVQNVLTSYCAPRTRPDKGFAGIEPPDNTAQFRARLEDNLSSFKFNSWDLSAIDKHWAIEDGMLAYTNTYGPWTTLPLNADASDEVKIWQITARKQGV